MNEELNDQSRSAKNETSWKSLPPIRSDDGERLLAHMEQFVRLVRKVPNGELICNFKESFERGDYAMLRNSIGSVHTSLTAPQRREVFAATQELSEQAQVGMEGAAERINLLCDEPGAQIVNGLLDPKKPDDVKFFEEGIGRFARALHLYLMQECPGEKTIRDRRFEQAEMQQALVHQAGQEKTSCQFMGPKGVVPELDDARRDELIVQLQQLYPQVKATDFIVETYHTQGTNEGVKSIDTVVWTITFNGKKLHYQYVVNGSIEEMETSTASSIRFTWSVGRGTLGVFCEDVEHCAELARFFVTIGMQGRGDFRHMPIWEFDLTGFSKPAMLTRLKTHRIEGIEGMEIRALTLFKPEIKTLCLQGKNINRRVENALVLKRHRHEDRDIYEVARRHHRIHDLSGYVVSQVKLGIRIAKTATRSAHSVSVHMSIPNGFSDQSKTKQDSALILKQLMVVGCARAV